MPTSGDDHAAVPSDASFAFPNGAIERRIHEMTCEVAASALEQIISPSLADFIA